MFAHASMQKTAKTTLFLYPSSCQNIGASSYKNNKHKLSNLHKHTDFKREKVSSADDSQSAPETPLSSSHTQHFLVQQAKMGQAVEQIETQAARQWRSWSLQNTVVHRLEATHCRNYTKCCTTVKVCQILCTKLCSSLCSRVVQGSTGK